MSHRISFIVLLTCLLSFGAFGCGDEDPVESASGTADAGSDSDVEEASSEDTGHEETTAEVPMEGTADGSESSSEGWNRPEGFGSADDGESDDSATTGNSGDSESTGTDGGSSKEDTDPSADDSGSGVYDESTSADDSTSADGSTSADSGLESSDTGSEGSDTSSDGGDEGEPSDCRKACMEDFHACRIAAEDPYEHHDCVINKIECKRACKYQGC